MDFSQIVYVVKLTSFRAKICPFCIEHLHGERIDECINHLVQRHGGIILHVGTEGANDGVLDTVAVIGFGEEPPAR